MSTSDDLRRRYYEAVENEEATANLVELLRANADAFRRFPDRELRIYAKDGGVNVDEGTDGVFSAYLRFAVTTNHATYRDISGIDSRSYYLDDDEREDVY